jgi:hypothetical protein
MRREPGAESRRGEIHIHGAHEANLNHPVASPYLRLSSFVSKLRLG